MYPIIPNMRISRYDRDNFVRNLLTVLLGDGTYTQIPVTGRPPTPTSRSVAAGAPVLTLTEIKLHLRIEQDQTEEDNELLMLEMAAHIHTQNVIQKVIDATAGENIKTAMLLLIAHWYRNRESTGAAITELPLAYNALLWPEKDFPTY